MAAVQETQQPLLESDHHNDNTSFGNNIVAAASAAIAPAKQPKTPGQKAIRKTFKGTAHLSNLLPTGSVLVFQTLSPAFTRQGKCPTAANHTMTILLLTLCSLACFLLCFTDSWRDERGKVRYGLATFRGLWIIDGSKVAVPAEEAANYRLRLIDFLHAFMSVLVFAAVALIDQNVVNCFYPNPSEEGKQLLAAFPVGIAIVCSILFLLLPTKRHGIGFPLSRS